MIKNPKRMGGIGAPDIDLKILSFRIIFLVKLHTYSSLKCFDYFIDRYTSIKSLRKNSTTYWAYPSCYRDLYNAEYKVGWVGKIC